MKEIYIRAKAVNGTYVYIPKGTADTYGTVLIDDDTLKYYEDTKGNTKLKVKGAALVDNNTLKSENDKLKVNGAALIDNNTIKCENDKLKVNSAKLVGNSTLYAVDNKLYVNVALVSRFANDEIWRNLDNKLDKGLIPSKYLPSYVDDVVEYDNKNAFPATGEEGKIYVDKSTNLTYRWSSNSNKYIMIGGGDLNVENGTGDVLIQTTDSNHSFKAMKDGRAKVYGEPTESDDVLRLNEFSVLTQSQVDLLF